MGKSVAHRKQKIKTKLRQVVGAFNHKGRYSLILRPRQTVFVKKCIDAIEKNNNTLGIAATGFGKTVAMSATIKNLLSQGKVLVLAHRDELTTQNSATFSTVNPGVSVSFYNSFKKSWRGKCVFGMVQTLSIDENLWTIPRCIDLLVIDECHHIASISYQKVINHVKEKNPKVKILGVTATPERSDRKGLRSVFDNIADVVPIPELIRTGALVPPVAKVIDIGTQEDLKNVSKTATDYNMSEVEAIQNTTINNRQIVDKWKEFCSGRVSVAFSSTIQHAIDVRDAFRDAGVEAEAVHGKLPKKERRAMLAAYNKGDIPIIINPMILTEGWDSQLCSAVLLLRMSSHKSTMIQMVGRGLRKIDPSRHPGVIKKDCIVLDFGISLLLHGDLNSSVRLHDKLPETVKEAPKKECPDCKAKIPISVKECPLCGYVFKVELLEDGCYNEIEELRLIEIDLINNSPFKWVSLFNTGKVMVSTGFQAWSIVCTVNGEDWHSLGGIGSEVCHLGITNKIGAISSADDFMRANETSRNAKKASRWMVDPASQKQIETLARFGCFGNRSKIEAAALLTFKFNQNKIERAIGIQ